MEKELLYEKIENYLNGSMTAADRSDFELEMAADTGLKKELMLHQSLADELADGQDLDFFKKLQNVDAAWEASGAKTRFFSLPVKRFLSVAAALVLLVSAFLFFMQTPDSQDIMTANFEPYDMVLNYRGNVEDANLADAISQYIAKDFEGSAATFEQLASAFPDNDAYPFYAGVSYLGAGEKTEKSLGIFSEIAADPNHIFQKQARWYLGLVYLKLNKKTEAIQAFAAIEKGDFQYLAAQEILGAL